MASPFSRASLFLLFLHFRLSPSQTAQAAGDGGKLVLEDGYTVTTVLDGDKSNFKVNPHSIIHQSPPSDLFILLDSAASTFYTVSLPTTSNETVIKKLAGNGQPGFSDGDLGSAMFNKPKSFAVDFAGNVYVADSRKNSIRKISKDSSILISIDDKLEGVTTIAGGSSEKAGRKDGPGREASFSDDFELTFIPQRCALMISDHGNRIVRQINLKAADCAKHSRSALGATSAWLLGLGISCVLGIIFGFVIRPYIFTYEGLKPLLRTTWTWTHCLTNLERETVILCSDIRNAIVKSTVFVFSLSRQIFILSLSQLSLVFRPKTVKSCGIHVKPVSLLDLDDEVCVSSSSSSNVVLPEVEELRDLLTFDGRQMLPTNANGVVERGKGREAGDVFSGGFNKIDGMIRANLVGFEDDALKVCSSGSVEYGLGGLVRRR